MIISATFPGITLPRNVVPLLQVEHGNAGSRKMVRDCAFVFIQRLFEAGI